MRIGSTYRKPLVWGMVLLALFIVLSPAGLRADACWGAFLECVTDLVAYLLDPLHLTYCISGMLFCYAYLPT